MKKKSYKIWDKKDSNFLIEKYKYMKYEFIAKKLKRTLLSVKSKTHKLGLISGREGFQKGHKINIRRIFSKKRNLKISKTRKKLFKENKIKPSMLGKNKSNESKLKMSKTMKRLFKEGKLKNLFKKGKLHPNYGKNIPKEVREKLSKIHKLNYKLGKEKSYWLGKKRSEETRLKHSKSMKKLYKEGKIKINSGCFKKGHKPKNGFKKGHTYGKRFKKGNKPSKKAKIGTSNRLKKWWKEGKLVLPVKDSSIEVKIQKFLEQLKIEFFTHKYMNIKHAYQCDILIPQWNMVIECDGDIFHFNPKLGYKPNDKIFRNGITAKEKWMLDYMRTKELQEKGYVVLRLWETDINKMSLEDFKKELKNKGFSTQNL